LSRRSPPGIFEIAEQYGEILRHLERFSEAVQQALAILAERGWVLTDSVSVTEVFEIVSIHAEEGPDALEAWLMDYFSAERCDRLVRGLAGRPRFDPWLPTLRKAMNAHMAGDFELAIPVWLIAFDGVFRSEVGHDPFELQAPKGSKAKRVSSAIESSSSAGMRALSIAAFIRSARSLARNRLGKGFGASDPAPGSTQTLAGFQR
jgi:hypothetical protein